MILISDHVSFSHAWCTEHSITWLTLTDFSIKHNLSNHDRRRIETHKSKYVAIIQLDSNKKTKAYRIHFKYEEYRIMP